MDTNENVMKVEKIMADIRQKIKDEGLTADMLSFEDIPLCENIVTLEGGYSTALLQQSTEYVSARYQVNINAPIEGNFIKVFVKKVIRKLILFFIAPIVTEQNALNYHYANAIMQLNGYINKNCNSDPAVLEEQLRELELKQMNSKREIAELTEQVKLLKNELAKLKAGE